MSNDEHTEITNKIKSNLELLDISPAYYRLAPDFLNYYKYYQSCLKSI